jgi:hypothetical protein
MALQSYLTERIAAKGSVNFNDSYIELFLTFIIIQAHVTSDANLDDTTNTKQDLWLRFVIL